MGFGISLGTLRYGSPANVNRCASVTQPAAPDDVGWV
jgi:hypothetical protein